MIYALLVAAVSVPGVCLARWLLRPMAPLPWDAPVEPDEPDDVHFGFDSRGLT